MQMGRWDSYGRPHLVETWDFDDDGEMFMLPTETWNISYSS